MDAAIAAFQGALHIDPNLAPAHGALGLVLWRNGDVESAIAEFQAAHQSQ